MANQYTKKKEADAKKQKAIHQQKMGRGTRVNKDNCSGSETVKVQPTPLPPGMYLWNLQDLIGKQFPLMSECDRKAQSQPHFTLLAQDNFAPLLIQRWIELAIEHRVSDDKVFEAKALLRKIQEWRTANPLKCKTPS